MSDSSNPTPRSDCLARLSPRAQRMLEFATWRKPPDDYESIIEMLESIGIEPTEWLVQLQRCYGSLDYHARYSKSVGLKFDLSAGFGEPEEDPHYLIDALDHRSAQLHFALDIYGRIYIETRLKNSDPIFWEPYAQSLSQLIEGDALLDEISELWGESVWVTFPYSGLAPTGLEECLHRFDPTFRRVKEASDETITWWINDSIRIKYHKAWLGYPNHNKYYFRAYGRSLEIARAFARNLIKVELSPVKELDFYSHTRRLYYGYP